VLHGLPTWSSAIDGVHVTRNRNSGGNRRVVVQVHAAPLTDGDMTAIDGVPVTSLAGMVLDLGRTLPMSRQSPPATEPWCSAWYAQSWRSFLRR
jgi:hypothetical protein